MKYAKITMAHEIYNLSSERGNREFCVPHLNYSVIPFWFLL